MNRISRPVLPAVPQARARVLIVEDHPMVRQGMRTLLDGTREFSVCGEVSTAQEALDAIAAMRPDIVCLDLILGDSDGFELIRAIRAANEKARILVLSVRDEELFAERCILAGALGYAMKTEPNEVLLAALRRVGSGDVHMSARAAMRVLERVREPSHTRNGLAGLTDRELQVFQLIGAGLSTRHIAERLGIGIKTVESHRENIKNKLGLEHSAQLVSEATRWVQRSS